MKRIYLDNAALTPIRKEVAKEVEKFSAAMYGNPSSIHSEGVRARKALDDARRRTAEAINAHPDEVVFTASGTEANNLAIFGVVRTLLGEGKSPHDLHVITSMIEHASVLESFRELERLGVSVSYIGVDADGIVRLDELKKALRPETVLVSLMYVNNEVGTIQPLHEIAKLVRHARKRPSIHGERFPLLHTDAAQAFLYLEVNVEKLGADLVVLDAHKVYGPRGVGLLYRKRGVALEPLIYGGGQEGGLRSATENLPGIAGFAKALALAAGERPEETARVTALRDYGIQELLKLPGVSLNGHAVHRIANNIHVSFVGKDTEFLTLQLDARGIAVSTKSSCLRDEDESYVLRAMGTPDPKNGLRITLGSATKKRDIDFVIRSIKMLQ